MNVLDLAKSFLWREGMGGSLSNHRELTVLHTFARRVGLGFSCGEYCKVSFGVWAGKVINP
jgi:hypothetical protein